MTVTAILEKIPDKSTKIEAAKALSDAEIDEIIESCGNIQGKIFL
jgi:hypothetical protein